MEHNLVNERRRHLARLAREYLANMLERDNEDEILEFLRQQAQGDFEEVVMTEFPQERV